MNEFKEFGICHSDRITKEAKKNKVDIELVAQGYTYTRRNGQYPPTNLGVKENIYRDTVFASNNILDFGCGVGRNLPWIYENTNATYWGLDPNHIMLNNFWKISDPKYRDRVNLCSRFEDFPDGLKFDVVLSTFVFQHLGYRHSAKNVMDLTDITHRIMEYTQPGTVWILFEHDKEEDWITRWMKETGIVPKVFIRHYGGWPELNDRGQHNHLMIWRQTQ